MTATTMPHDKISGTSALSEWLSCWRSKIRRILNYMAGSIFFYNGYFCIWAITTIHPTFNIQQQRNSLFLVKWNMRIKGSRFSMFDFKKYGNCRKNCDKMWVMMKRENMYRTIKKRIMPNLTNTQKTKGTASPNNFCHSQQNSLAWVMTVSHTLFFKSFHSHFASL